MNGSPLFTDAGSVAIYTSKPSAICGFDPIVEGVEEENDMGSAVQEVIEALSSSQ